MTNDRSDRGAGDDRRLGEAMAALEAPAPSEGLRRRVLAMAPPAPANENLRTRFAVAAALAVALAAAALLQGPDAGGRGAPAPVFAAADDALPADGVAPVGDGAELEDAPGDDGVALVDAPAEDPDDAEPVLLAGLPLE